MENLKHTQKESYQYNKLIWRDHPALAIICSWKSLHPHPHTLWLFWSQAKMHHFICKYLRCIEMCFKNTNLNMLLLLKILQRLISPKPFRFPICGKGIITDLPWRTDSQAQNGPWRRASSPWMLPTAIITIVTIVTDQMILKLLPLVEMPIISASSRLSGFLILCSRNLELLEISLEKPSYFSSPYLCSCWSFLLASSFPAFQILCIWHNGDELLS